MGGYKDVELDLERAKAARDPAVAELHERVARDQAARVSLSIWGGSSTYARGLSRDALKLLDLAILRDVETIDADNREWLRRTIARRGWFKVSRDGAAADSAAWLIVQHADADREFQRTSLKMLEPLAASGETSKRGYAMLYDRWANGAGQPQRFGLYGRCVAPGVWEPYPISEAADVEARRLDAELTPLAEQVQRQTKTCR